MRYSLQGGEAFGDEVLRGLKEAVLAIFAPDALMLTAYRAASYGKPDSPVKPKWLAKILNI